MVELNFEASANAEDKCTVQNSCVVTVRATDSAGLATEPADNADDPDLPHDMTVTITIKNVNEKPTFGAITADQVDDNGGHNNVTSQSIPENATGDGDDGLEVATYTATDTDANDTVLLSLRGDDAAMFRLADDTEPLDNSASQILSFKASPNYEDPKDKDGNNIYEVIVRASDRGNLYAEKSLTVRVTNMDEAPYFMKDTPTSYKFAENGKEAVATFTATDPEGAKITWSVPSTVPSPLPSGFVDADFADREDFDINATTGALTFDVGGDNDPDVSVSPDFESAGDTGTDNTYNLVVAAADNDSTSPQTGYHKVTVMVTNVDEDGVVTWTVDYNADGTEDTPTLLQFQDGAILDASATDGDVSGPAKTVTITGWQWYKSSSNSSCGTNELSGNGADSNEYTVQGEDRGSYLCAKASYSIGGTPYSAYKVSKYKVGRDLAEENANPTFGPDTSIARMVDEDKKGMMVGDPVTATDADSASSFGDQLNYTLLGTDATKFKIDQETGQITTMVALNFEADANDAANCTAQNACVVTVRATDSAGAATDEAADGATPDDMEVTITIKDVNEEPTFNTPASTDLRTAIDSPEGQTDLTTTDNVDNVTYEAMDADAGDTAILVLEGLDKDMFQLDAIGVLSFTTKPDYENPMDEGEDNRYNVIVRATDGTLHADRMIAVNVTDVNEAPDLTRGGLSISGSVSVSVTENSPVTDAVETYTATGPDAASAAWSLSGDDEGEFRIAGGVLTFKTAPDFENPTDANTDNVYMVMVEANDGTFMASRNVRVTVTNMDDPGSVTGLPATAMVGDTLTAELDDEDAGVTRTTWQWVRGGTEIGGATSASYTVGDDDAGMSLSVTATYYDIHGSQTASSDAVMVAAADGNDIIDYGDVVTAYTKFLAGNPEVSYTEVVMLFQRFLDR